jgi:ribonuclease-3
MNPDTRALSRLQEGLGYTFQDPGILITALTHKSFANENPGLQREDNERLEFLGDSVLSLIISNHLYRRHPELNEGELSKIRAHLVKETSLAAVARAIGLGEFLFLGKGEDGTAGREKVSLLSDTLEAVIAGVYLDSGLRAVTKVVLAHCRDLIEAALERKQPSDYKTALQELCQERFGVLPEYTLSRSTGPDHKRVFVMELSVKGEVLGAGSGRSKKEAQQEAAREALESFRKKKSRARSGAPAKSGRSKAPRAASKR